MKIASLVLLIVAVSCFVLSGVIFVVFPHGFRRFSADSKVFESGFGTDNNGYELNGEEVDRLLAVKPSDRQLAFNELEYYNFIHFGMNTFTGNEWGDGITDPSVFNPTNLSTDQWVKTLLDSGSKGVILTAKHHDGFCLFPSEYTDYTIANSPYKNGKGDIVGELAESCKKYGLKFGVYLSPWDMHEPTYGTPAYNDFFINQLTELCTNYGELFSVWFDGAKGKDVPDFKYDFERYYNLIRELQPNAAITVCGPDVRWVGNEAGVARESEWSVVPASQADTNLIQGNSQSSKDDAARLKKAKAQDMKNNGSRELMSFYKDLIWYPAEVDVSIRNGWFYHEEEKPKTLQHLLKIYYGAVGGNSSLLLNIPPNKEGLIDAKDVARLAELGDAVRTSFQNNLTDKIFVGDTNHMNEGHTNLYDEGMDSVKLNDNEYIMDIKLKSESKVSFVVLREDLRMSQRVEAFDVYIKQDYGWLRVAEGGNIGSRRIIRLDNKKVPKTDTVRIVFKQSRSNPYIRFAGLY